MSKPLGKAFSILSPIGLIGNLLGKEQKQPKEKVAPVPDDEKRRMAKEREAAQRYGGAPRANTILSQGGKLG